MAGVRTVTDSPAVVKSHAFSIITLTFSSSHVYSLNSILQS